MILASQMLPGIAILVPLYVTMRTLGLIYTFQGLILAYLSFNLPYVICCCGPFSCPFRRRLRRRPGWMAARGWGPSFGTIPILILVMVFQRYIIHGLTEGAIRM